MKIVFFVLAIILSHLTFSQTDTLSMFIMGHSLIQHEPGGMRNDSTTIAHWIYSIGKQAQNNIAVSGQYGFLRQHDDLNPIPQWGYDSVPPVWDYDANPNFSDQDFETLLITAGNFIQENPPGAPFEEGDPATPLSSTRTIVDWLNVQEPGMDIIIYENWPDMGPYVAGQGFPPSIQEFETYNNFTRGAFHDWWIEYQDSLRSSHPINNIRMVPVGPILADLFEDTLLTQIPILDLYEDNAPHGRDDLYFLAGLITYMAIFEEKAPAGYTVPSEFNPLIATNYNDVVDYIWNYLIAFNDLSGNTRVFTSNLVTGDSDGDGIDDSIDNCPNSHNPNQEDADNNGIGDVCEVVNVGAELINGALYIDNSDGIVLKGKDGNCYLIYIDHNGTLKHAQRACPE